MLMDELFSLSISEGAICNILARARQPLLDATAAIEKVVLASPVVCSDETSVRVKGKNWGSRNTPPGTHKQTYQERIGRLTAEIRQKCPALGSRGWSRR